MNAEDNITISDQLNVHFFPTACHSKFSYAYYLEPAQALIVDEGWGYFRGKEFAAPGADYSIDNTNDLISKTKRLSINILCLPYSGSISGRLFERHMGYLEQNTADLISEVKRAKSDGINDTEIRTSIKQSFYQTDSKDPALKRPLKKLLKQYGNS